MITVSLVLFIMGVLFLVGGVGRVRSAIVYADTDMKRFTFLVEAVLLAAIGVFFIQASFTAP